MFCIETFGIDYIFILVRYYNFTVNPNSCFVVKKLYEGMDESSRNYDYISIVLRCYDSTVDPVGVL